MITGFEDFNYIQAILLTIALYVAYKIGEIRSDFNTYGYIINKINDFYENKRKNTTANDMIEFIFPGYTKK